MQVPHRHVAALQALEENAARGVAGLPQTPALLWQLVHAVAYLHSHKVSFLRHLSCPQPSAPDLACAVTAHKLAAIIRARKYWRINLLPIATISLIPRAVQLEDPLGQRISP